MKRSSALMFSILLALTGLSGLGLAKDQAAESQWAASPMTIDGFDSDWVGAPRMTSEDGLAEYALKNDGTNLYVLFAIRNPKFLTNISKTGLTVYFSPAGKKSKDRGIRFVRLGVPTDIYISSLEKSGLALSEEKKAELRTKPFQVVFNCQVLGYKPDKDAPPKPEGPDAPVYAAVGNQSFVVFECRIPLSRESHPGGVGIEPGKPLKIGFEWGGSTKKGQISGPQNPGLGDTESETPQRESEDMPSQGSGLDEIHLRARSPKKFSFWADTTLAAHQ
jgi:hypothetical protein